ncbi:hypothetical protein [Nocardia takedensis]|uniref:hypothetical protein n=1 Tax=Nocardia takedensis TaxID=259390 RepID=UPI0012F6568C|nr:hypothetical protein [Nocardia takedensis]
MLFTPHSPDPPPVESDGAGIGVGDVVEGGEMGRLGVGGCTHRDGDGVVVGAGATVAPGIGGAVVVGGAGVGVVGGAGWAAALTIPRVPAGPREQL